jgi:hypothetical protein
MKEGLKKNNGSKQKERKDISKQTKREEGRRERRIKTGDREIKKGRNR